jgi:anti-sigma B factor antagonist
MLGIISLVPARHYQSRAGLRQRGTDGGPILLECSRGLPKKVVGHRPPTPEINLAEEREFRIELLRPSEDVAVVVAEGEIDIFTAPRLQETLTAALESETRRLIVDITGVSFIDSTGLSVLIGAVRRLQERGTRLGIVGGQRNVMRVFEVTGLQSAFTFYATREEALTATGSSPAA